MGNIEFSLSLPHGGQIESTTAQKVYAEHKEQEYETGTSCAEVSVFTWVQVQA